ncbi:MAG: carboxypeptidase regulatory-like domain-containing protein [Blastocatellales bacterium]
MPTLTGYAQSTTTGAIVGTVTDTSGAVLPNAQVDLINTTTSLISKAVTTSDGKYFFPAVPPGRYNLTVTKDGFRKTSITDIQVEVTKTYTFNPSLEVGNFQQTVEVTATGTAELQTVDSTVGNVISGKVLPLLPALTRQANELLNYQPMSTPGGAVAGSREDQSTFTLDGIDVTNNSVGGTGTFIRLPIEGVEEFSVGVTNANASFGRGGGGQAAIISKRGSNDFHGATYWYHQNDNLNAASWTNKRTLAQTVTDPVARAKAQKPEFKDNRFGFNVGGPVLPFKDKAFFFLNYEGQRNPRNTGILRLVPTDTLKQGILRFRDASGNIVNYDLKTSQLCGPSANAACDPRGLGLSPSISAMWAKLPAGNDPSSGDGLNTVGFRGNVGNPLNNDYYAARFDYNLTDNWRVDGSFRYFGQTQAGSGLIDIQGGDVLSREQFPLRQNFVSAGITGTISPTLTGEFRFGWVRNRNAVDRFRPNQTAELLAIPGTNTSAGYIALDIGAIGGTESLLSEPINVGTQVARKQASDNKNFQYNADLTWLKNDHTFQFGAHLRYLPTFHLRDDKVVGSLGALVAQIDSDLGGGVAIPAASRPPTCSSTVTTNCLPSGDVQQWNRLMAGALGLVDNISVLAVRDASFKPLPFGEVLVADTTLWAPDFYVQDVWRLTPSLTFTWGLNYGWQTPPKEKQNRFTVQVDGTTLQPQTAKQYLTARESAAAQGNIYNPQIAFLPVDVAKRDVFNIDWNNLGPRASAAWNPSFTDGWMGKVFGDKKTVIRGGYSLIYDRQNTVQSVIIPTLGVAFGQTINVTGPRCDATGGAGPLCDPNNSNPVLGGYRVGQDGTIPLPTVPNQTIPASPFWGILPGSAGPPYPSSALRLFPEVLSFQVDPDIQVGKNHSFNVTWQRELPGNMLLEVGYVGRFANELTQSMSFGQVPYNFLDKTSGQTFAQAFDALAIQMRAGTAAASVALQPWFENLVPGGTRAVAAAQGSNIINGNINNVFLDVDRRRMLNGLAPFNNYMAQTLFLRSSVGKSNYNAGFVTLEKRLSRGLLFTANYTFSKAMDQFGAIQNAASVMPNNFDLDAEYGPSPFDIRHLFNATGVYDLPFGKGRMFDPGIGFLDKIIGGWYTSGIFTARSGDPLTVTQGAGVWGGSLFLGFTSGAIPTSSVSSFNAGLKDGINGSNNIGTNGDPANRGTALNLFSNPEQVFNNFRRVEISRDGRAGRANPIYGLPRWNMDLTLGKKTTFAERVNVTFLFDFINLFNNVNFNNPSLSLTNPRGFGVITSQNGNPRQIQFGMRVEF